MADSENEYSIKCPVCNNGTINFEEGKVVEAFGECDNSQNHTDWGFFEIKKLSPLIINYETGPLRKYVFDMEVPRNLRNDGLNFYLRGDGDCDDEQLVDALVNAIEGAKEMLDEGYADAVKQFSIDWFDREEIDDGITEYILEDPN